MSVLESSVMAIALICGARLLLEVTRFAIALRRARQIDREEEEERRHDRALSERSARVQEATAAALGANVSPDLEMADVVEIEPEKP